jgi:tight adherence protein C
MMTLLVIFFASMAAGLLVVGFANLLPSGTRVMKRRLAILQTGASSYRELQEQRRRQAKREQFETLLSTLGTTVSSNSSSMPQTRQWLAHGGYRSQQAGAIFMGLRVMFAALGVTSVFLITAAAQMTFQQILMLAAIGGLFGWMLPYFHVSRKVRKRQESIRLALPDSLDLMVVCVEAGLALNQAIVRVAEEIDRVSPEMSEELTIINLEIRAGTPRDEALRHFAERTGVEDVKAFVSMLLQTDRFGTSIADSLRVHADTLRTKRRQRAEEAAAKLTVKMLFPLIMFVFPAFFVVLLGPSIFLFKDFFAGGIGN